MTPEELNADAEAEIARLCASTYVGGAPGVDNLLRAAMRWAFAEANEACAKVADRLQDMYNDAYNAKHGLERRYNCEEAIIACHACGQCRVAIRALEETHSP